MIITQIKSKNEYNFKDNPDKDFMTECAKVDHDRRIRKIQNRQGTVSYCGRLSEHLENEQ